MAFIIPFIPAIVGAAVAVAGTAMTARSQRLAGQAQADQVAQQSQYYGAAKAVEASQYEEQALEETAAAQRAAQEEKRRSRVLQSRAMAVAGASGGGVSDPTIVDIVSDLEGEGAYRAALATYEGDQRSRNLRNAASAARWEGLTGLQSGSASAASLSRAGSNAATGTIFQGAGQVISIFGKYGLPSTSSPQTWSVSDPSVLGIPSGMPHPG